MAAKPGNSPVARLKPHDNLSRQEFILVDSLHQDTFNFE